MNSDYMLCSGVRRAQFDLGGGITLTCSDNMSKLGRKRRVNLTLRNCHGPGVCQCVSLRAGVSTPGRGLSVFADRLHLWVIQPGTHKASVLNLSSPDSLLTSVSAGHHHHSLCIL